MTKDKAYWKARALLREEESYARGAALSAKLFEEYDTAAKAIRREIGDFYTKYAGKHGLTYEQAVRRLSRREFQEWKGGLGEYVERIAAETDPQVRERLTAQLDALSANSSISRLEALQGQINLILNDLYQKGTAQMKAEFGDAFQSSYYHKAYDLQSRAGWLNEFAKLNAGMIENAVSYPWSGAMFSDRLWQNKQALAFHLRETVTQGLIRGKGIASMSKALSNRLGQSYKNAERVIRTETSHLHNEAEKAAYAAAGVKEYEFMATLESRTCGDCGALDGKHYPLADAQPGVNFPPLHPNCRCTTVEYDPEDAQDRQDSGEPMPENMTYEEWAKRQGVAGPAKEKAGASPIKAIKEPKKPAGLLPEEAPAEAFFDPEAIKKSTLEKLEKSDGLQDNITILKYYVENTEYVATEKLPVAMGYDPKADVIRYSTKIPMLRGADREGVLIHELSHRADVLMYGASESKEWQDAVERTTEKIAGMQKEIEKWFAEGGKYVKEPFFSDIMSALTKDSVNVPYHHNAEYWEKPLMREREIFANLSAMDAIGTPGLQEFSGVLKDLYDTFKAITGGNG